MRMVLVKSFTALLASVRCCLAANLCAKIAHEHPSGTPGFLAYSLDAGHIGPITFLPLPERAVLVMNSMKAMRRLGCFLFLSLGLLPCERAGAQLFGLSVTNFPASPFPGQPLLYTINVTNFAVPGNFLVTNFLPPSVQFVSASSSLLSATISNSPGLVIFNLGGIAAFPFSATLNVNVIPTNSGPLTDIATAGLQGTTNFISATNITFVGNPATALALGLTPPAVAVVANDWMTYSVSVTNIGTNVANNLVVSNVLPPGVGLTPANPASPPFTLVGNVMVFNLGSFPPGASQTLSFVMQPTNTGALTNLVLPLIAGAVADHADPVTITNDITILPFDTTQLVAANASAMAYDPQNGLLEQAIQLSNIGTNQIASSRVIVSGLTNLLFNAVGTNNGNPFVQYSTNLGPGQNVNLLLQYFVPTRQTITVPNSSYAAVPVPAVTPPLPAGTSIPVTLVTNLPGSRLLIEFQAIPGRTYSVLYSDNPAMSNSLAAAPVVVAPADRAQWIDYGPPGTISLPASVSSRFYLVVLHNP
jgi:uncharacterized repeat protein (TIGR01451 family)